MHRTADPEALVSAFVEKRQLPKDVDLHALIRAYSRSNVRAEGSRIELKSMFRDDPSAWMSLKRHVVALNNSGGGVLIFGIDESGRSSGLTASLVKTFDASNILSKLRQHAPSASIPLSYIESTYYNKLYGFLFVGTNGSIVIFDKIGNVQRSDGKGQESAFRPGIVYVRREGETAEARQYDLDNLINETVSRGVTAFLARIERVASLPSNTEILARQPGSDRAYVLVAAGQGVPVEIVTGNSETAVPLSEVLTSELALSSLEAEVVGQIRQWRTDPGHRVGAVTLDRWYLGRDALSDVPACAEFCFRSAAQNHGFPMYWASEMNREALEELVVKSMAKHPANRIVPYVIGAFFFPRRKEILESVEYELSPAAQGGIKRLLEASTSVEYLCRARLSVDKFPFSDRTYQVRDLANRIDLAREVFDQLVALHQSDQLSPGLKQVAHQLDMVVHGDRAAGN